MAPGKARREYLKAKLDKEQGRAYNPEHLRIRPAPPNPFTTAAKSILPGANAYLQGVAKKGEAMGRGTGFEKVWKGADSAKASFDAYVMNSLGNREERSAKMDELTKSINNLNGTMKSGLDLKAQVSLDSQFQSSLVLNEALATWRQISRG